MFQWQVSLIITEIIGMTIFCLIKVGKIIEFKPLFNQLSPGDLSLAFRISIQQDPAVFSQGVVNVAHDIITVAVEAVIKCAPALIGAEFFIGAAHDLVTAFNTFGVHVNKYKGEMV
jgi:hypothetical protein